MYSSCPTTIYSETSELFTKLGRNYLHSGIMTFIPNGDSITIDGVVVDIDIPAEDELTKGIIWSDPCVSSKFVNCLFEETWNTYERSYEMLNALADR